MTKQFITASYALLLWLQSLQRGAIISYRDAAKATGIGDTPMSKAMTRACKAGALTEATSARRASGRTFVVGDVRKWKPVRFSADGVGPAPGMPLPFQLQMHTDNGHKPTPKDLDAQLDLLAAAPAPDHVDQGALRTVKDAVKGTPHEFLPDYAPAAQPSAPSMPISQASLHANTIRWHLDELVKLIELTPLADIPTSDLLAELAKRTK